jgi:hypothetical protein
VTSSKETDRHGTAADHEETAELEELRDRADQAGREAAETLGELTERLLEAGNPRVLARQAAGHARSGAVHAVAQARKKALETARQKIPGGLAGTRVALTAVPVLVLLVGAAIAYRRLKS